MHIACLGPPLASAQRPRLAACSARTAAPCMQGGCRMPGPGPPLGGDRDWGDRVGPRGSDDDLVARRLAVHPKARLTNDEDLQPLQLQPRARRHMRAQIWGGVCPEPPQISASRATGRLEPTLAHPARVRAMLCDLGIGLLWQATAWRPCPAGDRTTGSLQVRSFVPGGPFHRGGQQGEGGGKDFQRECEATRAAKALAVAHL